MMLFFVVFVNILIVDIIKIIAVICFIFFLVGDDDNDDDDDDNDEDGDDDDDNDDDDDDNDDDEEDSGDDDDGGGGVDDDDDDDNFDEEDDDSDNDIRHCAGVFTILVQFYCFDFFHCVMFLWLFVFAGESGAADLFSIVSPGNSSDQQEKGRSMKLPLISFMAWPRVLTLPIQGLLSSKAQFLKTIYYVGIHWIALAEYSQMSTHMPGFQIFLRCFASFCQISHHQD